MNQREWFSVGVRLLGVWLLIDGIGELVTIGQVLCRLVTPTRTSLGAYVLHAAVDFLVGLYFIGGAQLLMRLAYPRPGDPPYCRSCGYSLTGNTSDTCPECGTRASLKPADDSGR